VACNSISRTKDDSVHRIYIKTQAIGLFISKFLNTRIHILITTLLHGCVFPTEHFAFTNFTDES
jgi:hypothetical protein